MQCPECTASSHIFIASCRGCSIRDLAQGPLFADAVRHQKLSPKYREACAEFGAVADVHAEVKAAAKRYIKGGRG